MTDEVNAKNTKNEILEAYHEALEQLKSAKKASKQEIKSVEEKKETITKAVSHSTDDIVKNMALSQKYLLG
jgi:predicted  nucleic acid-binding Zn-ribbon protein